MRTASLTSGVLIYPAVALPVDVGSQASYRLGTAGPIDQDQFSRHFFSLTLPTPNSSESIRRFSFAPLRGFGRDFDETDNGGIRDIQKSAQAADVAIAGNVHRRRYGM